MQVISSLAQLPLTDDYISGSTPAFVQLQSAARTTQFHLATQRFPARRGFDAAVFDEKLYMAGALEGSASLNDVWVSPDGADWRRLWRMSRLHWTER